MVDDTTPTIAGYLIRVAVLNEQMDFLPIDQRAVARASLNAPVGPLVLLHHTIEALASELKSQRLAHLNEQARLWGLIADLRDESG